jgi:two-component system, OmpR family, sensor kinase
MARHFLQLYLLIVATLAAASWGQEQLWQAYGRPSAAEGVSQGETLAVVEQQLRSLPASGRQAFVADLSTRTGVDLELFETQDVAGPDTLARLSRGELAVLNAADGETWTLKRVEGDGRLLALRSGMTDSNRSPLEWAMAFAFYAAIGLVIMMWLWPLTRDLRRLERSTSTFGDRNWAFDADIHRGSQIYPLAEAFHRMAARIDSLIGSHKDMSNAIAHEIKTPLARMRFEIEMARAAGSGPVLAEHLDHITRDIAELNAFVTAALDYAILERAEVTLNIGEHDFTRIVPPVTEAVKRGAPSHLDIRCEVPPGATRVVCDAHLMETVLRNLLYNAVRFARQRICVRFREEPAGLYTLEVEDDGPGVPEPDRERVFGSFVQLDAPRATKTGYGLGLAIVKRVVEWHHGEATISTSSLGGACFSIQWPASAQADRHV